MLQQYFQRARVLGLLAFSVCATAYGAGPPIVIGQSAGLTGGQAAFSKDAQTGISAYFAAVNKAGGVAGRPLKLVTEDDGGKRDSVVANTRKLVEETKAFALIGYKQGLASKRCPLIRPRCNAVAADGEHGDSGTISPLSVSHTCWLRHRMNTVIRQFSLSGSPGSHWSIL
jgi:hypothetical protein